MSDRYTRKDAVGALERLAGSCGHRVGYGIGEWHLDYNSVYGGYVVHETMTQGGGVCEPFGSLRRSARDFCDAVRFATQAVNEHEQSRREATVPA